MAVLAGNTGQFRQEIDIVGLHAYQRTRPKADRLKYVLATLLEWAGYLLYFLALLLEAGPIVSARLRVSCSYWIGTPWRTAVRLLRAIVSLQGAALADKLLGWTVPLPQAVG